jgi:protocatechuate 3,4-dioxygenase beta subunit
MKRFQVHLVAVLALVFSSHPSGQVTQPGAQAPRPGLPTPGATAPGFPPPRDNVRGAQTGTARLKGRVVAQGGTPLRRAQVSLVSAENVQLRRSTTTDTEGRYEFLELPAGRFNLTAVKTGYVTLQYGQRRPYETGTPVSIADAQAVERIDFTLPKGSVIAIRVTDEFGEPVGGAMVQVQRFQYGADGQRRPASVASGSPFGAATDDRGEFRAYGLMPGEYVVQATVRNALGPTSPGGASDSGEGFSPTYYPGTISAAEAQAITVRVGEETSVQFPMVVARLARVTGTIVDSAGRPAAGAGLSLVTVTAGGMSSSGVGQVSADGTFALSGVAPGEHSLRVTQSRTGAAGEFASVPLAIGGTDVSGLHITMGTGATVSGRVVFEGTSPRTGGPVTQRVTAAQADPQRQLSLIMGPTDPLANGTLDAEGNFKLAGVSGRVFFGMTAPQGWILKSVTADGDDITDVPVDMDNRALLSDVRIVLTDKLTDVAGQVTDARGLPLKDYVVIIQPAATLEPIVASRSIRVVRPDTSGRFQVRGMRPGRYVATALESLEQGRQFSPEFQKELRRDARPFAVREGETITVDLRLTPDL